MGRQSPQTAGLNAPGNSFILTCRWMFIRRRHSSNRSTGSPWAGCPWPTSLLTKNTRRSTNPANPRTPTPQSKRAPPCHVRRSPRMVTDATGPVRATSTPALDCCTGSVEVRPGISGDISGSGVSCCPAASETCRETDAGSVTYSPSQCPTPVGRENVGGKRSLTMTSIQIQYRTVARKRRRRRRSMLRSTMISTPLWRNTPAAWLQNPRPRSFTPAMQVWRNASISRHLRKALLSSTTARLSGLPSCGSALEAATLRLSTGPRARSGTASSGSVPRRRPAGASGGTRRAWLRPR